MSIISRQLHVLKKSGHFSQDYIVTALLEMGMSESMYEAWLEHTSDGEEVLNYDVLMEFLEKRMRASMPKTPAGIKANQSKTSSPKKSVKAQVLHVQPGSRRLCSACNHESQQLYQCPQVM